MPKNKGEKPKHAAPPRGATRGEKANAKAKETGDKAKFNDAARQAAQRFTDEQDAKKALERERREGEQK